MLETRILIENENIEKQRVARNRLKLLAFLNAMTFFCCIFSMVFYEWIYVSFQIKVASNLKVINQKNETISLWINLLYVQKDSSYYYFEDVENQICEYSDLHCKAMFYELSFIGNLCFFIFMLAYMLQIYDLFQIGRYIIKSKHSKQKYRGKQPFHARNNFRNICTVATYVIGMTLNYYSMTLIDLISYEYGVSFWIFFSSLLLFLAILVYQNISMRTMAKNQMILSLIQKQNQLRKEQQAFDQENQSEGRSSVFQV